MRPLVLASMPVRRWRCCVSILLVQVVLTDALADVESSPRSAQAAELPGVAVSPRYRLVWRIGSHSPCATARDFANGVEQRVGRSVFDPSAARALEVALIPKRGGWTLSLRVRNADGMVTAQRSLQSSSGDCQGVLAGAALALELLLAGDDIPDDKPETVPEELPPTPSGSPSDPNLELPAARRSRIEPVQHAPEPAPGSNERAPVRPGLTSVAAPESKAAERSWELTATALAHVGMLPEFAWGVGVAGSYRLASRWRVELFASLSQRTSAVRQFEGARVELGMRLGRVGLGAAWSIVDVPAFRGELHSALHLGQLLMQVDGARQLGDRGRWWWAGSLGLRARTPLGESWFLAAQGDALLQRGDEFRTLDSGQVAATLVKLPPVGGLVGMGIGMNW